MFYLMSIVAKFFQILLVKFFCLKFCTISTNTFNGHVYMSWV